MKKFLFLLMLCLSFSLIIKAQDAENNKEKDAVKQAVETYLFSEEEAERKQVLSTQAKIFSTNPENNKVEETAVYAKAKKRPKGTKTVSVQKVVDIDMAEDAANVKVETDLSSADRKIPKHFQYISLLKVGGEWKIVGILMPKIKLIQ